jgi:hypothetical protein
MQEDKPLTRYSLKNDMINWLKNKGIQVNGTMHKVDLYTLVELNMSKEKKFRTDSKLVAFSHTVLQLPPYMCDLNMTELAWAKIKCIVKEKNVTGDLSVQSLQAFSEDAVNSVTKEDWEGYCQDVGKIVIGKWTRFFLI